MSISVGEIVAWTGGQIVNSDELGDAALAAIRVDRPAPLGRAKGSDLAFFYNRAYQAELATAAPGVLITAPPFVDPMRAAALPLWRRTAVIACADPYLTMADLSARFAARVSSVAHLPGTERGATEVHPSAAVDPTAQLGPGVRVGAHCTVAAGVRIGAGTVLYPGCSLGPEVVVGEDCVLFAGVALYEWTELGDRIRIHAGSVLGSDGFGYAPRREGREVVEQRKIFHLGRVVVGDDVEIGANSCVDRGTFGETRIERGAKLDNLVHVGHNATVGEGAIICGGTCLAGRAKIGKFAYIGGLTGITNDVHVGDRGSVGALALVTKDVEPGGTAVGNPQREYREHFRAHAWLNRQGGRKPAGLEKPE